MMQLKYLIPEFISSTIKKNILRAKNPTCIINTHMISRESKIGKKVRILRHSEVFGTSSLGDYSYINANSIVCNTKIGKFTSIGYNCVIGANEHPVHYMSTSPHMYGDSNLIGEEKYFDEFKNDTIIGNDCWIGSNCVIKQGIDIGDGAIIGAGSIITKDVEEFSVVAGVPGKKLKMRFSEDKIQYLKQLKWWDLSEHQIKELRNIFLGKEHWYNEI